MSTHETLTIALPVALVNRVHHAVEAGEFESADAAISAALSEWDDRRSDLGYGFDELRTLAAEGLRSGPSVLSSIADLKAEARRRSR